MSATLNAISGCSRRATATISGALSIRSTSMCEWRARRDLPRPRADVVHHAARPPRRRQPVEQPSIEGLRDLRAPLFMAGTVRALGPGGQNLAEKEFGWSGQTIRKGEHELESGIECLDGRRGRGPKRAEEIFPNLFADIRAIVDGQSQTDPQFRNQRLYTRLSAAEVRRQLVKKHGYQESTAPSAETIRVKLNVLGYHPARVAKTKPKKRSRKPTPSLTP